MVIVAGSVVAVLPVVGSAWVPAGHAGDATIARQVPQRIVADTSLRTEPERFPWVWAVPAMLLPFGTLAAGIALYPDMPASVPARTRGSEVVAVFLRRVGRALLVLAAAVNVTLLLAFTATWRGHAPGPWTTAGMLLISLLVVAYVLVVAVRTGQGGSRVDTPAGRPARAADHLDDDRHWRAGILYVNRADPALMVQKRVGIGWTSNFGNPWGIVILAGVLALVVAAALVPALQS
jgi:uncharacterized membrane protein